MSAESPPSGSMSMETPSLVGQVLGGRYRLTKKLGEGGMGEVYAAEHVHIEKRFALKLLRPEIVSNKEAVQRFYQEARSSSSIGHRNIIGIEDFGELPDGRLYMCMELLNGAPLNDIIMQPQPVERLLNILIQTGHGLAAAHAKGIVHRDMKPENIFVTISANNEDVPKLLDFGIAKVAGNEGQNNLTRTGTIFGTPFYMAPEQALGNPVDARTDVYAMGIIAYEVFAGTLPFQGESFMGILTQHITTEPEPVAQRAAKANRPMPPGLAEVITRCLQKDPNQRFQTMDELVNALIPIYRSVAGAGMSTYMEAFPVGASASHPVATPPHGAASPTMGVGAPPGVQPGYGYPPPPQQGGWQAPPAGQHVSGGSSAVAPIQSASSSGMYAGASGIVEPKKSNVGLLIAIFAVLLVGGGITAFLLLNGKSDGSAESGSGSQAGGGTPDAAIVATTVDAAGGTIAAPDADVPTKVAADAAVAMIADAATTEPANGSNDPLPADAAVDEPPPTDAAVETPASFSATLQANVDSFEIWENGSKIAAGPGELDVPENGKRKLVIKATGYKDQTITIDTKKKYVTVKLAKIASIPTHPNPPRPKCSGAFADMSNATCRPLYCKAHPTTPGCDAE